MKQNYIGGEWVDGATAKPNVNPSDTSDIVDEYAQGDEAQTLQAIAAAKAALPAWRHSNVQARCDLLEAVGTKVIERKDELGELLAREEGKTLAEGIGEVVRAGQTIKFYAGEALRIHGMRVPSIRPGVDIEIVREPMGVIGIITPWNFPMAIPGWKIAPALAFGNTVVFKPADLVPGCGWALSRIIAECGVPDGVFNLVMGRGSVVGETILTSPDVNGVTFTGSVDTGKHVAMSCAARNKKFQLEMGGKNPMIVLDDADLDTAVATSLNGAFFSTGQKCTASSRLIVTEGIHDRFVDRMREGMQALNVDHALKDGTQIGPVVDRSQLDQDLEYIEIGRSEGATVTGGELLNRDTEGFYLSPALFTETDNSMRINREEIFGPVSSVLRVKDYDEALAVANDTDFGLSSAICTGSLKYAEDFKKNSEAGMVMVNLPTAGVDYHVPFGGRKGSSMGAREMGPHSVEFYTATKTSYTAA
jgi:aldehyde dehydrogenase (NAD+)